MWERIDPLLERAPHLRALRFHRVELLEARRRRAAGLKIPSDLADDVARAAMVELAVPVLLEHARAAWDGRLVLFKGPEVALDYGTPGLRRFGDLDLLTDDAPAAQAALLSAGFGEVGDPTLYADIHHLRPLAWPGLPITIELHARPKWPAALPRPTVDELLASAVPSRVGVPGLEALPPALHAVVVAAHAWAHEPLARLGDLVDVAVTADRAGWVETGVLARAWGCGRLWRTTGTAAEALLHGSRRSGAAWCWARHLSGVREPTVVETHLRRCLAPLWGETRRRALPASVRAVRDDVRRDGAEPWRTKAARSVLAVANAGTATPDHDLALQALGYTTRERAGDR